MDKNVIWDRTPPQLYIKCSVYVWGRAQGSQIFKWNSIILICSKVIASLVICCPRGCVSSPCRPHIVSIVSQGDNMVPMVPIVPASSPLFLHRPRSPHCLPRLSYPISSSTTPGDTRMVSASSPRHVCRPQVVSSYLMLSPPPTITSNLLGT